MSSSGQARARRLLRHGKPVLIYSLALLLAGAWSARGLPVAWKASVELPRLLIVATWPRASPRAVEQQVTAPIERVLQRVRGVAGVDSVSSGGQAVLEVDVAPTRALGPFLVDVADRLEGLKHHLPDRVRPRLAYETPEALREEESFFTLQVAGGHPRQTNDWVETVLAPRLRSLPGVAAVTAEGGSGAELRVATDRARLAVYDLTSERLGTELRHALTGRALGRVRDAGHTGLFVRAPLDTLEQVRSLALGGTVGVRLSDVADVALADAPARVTSRVDGRPAVTLRVDRAPDGNVLRLAEAVRQTLAELSQSLPPGMRLSVVDDRSEEVRRYLADLALRSTIGLLLILGVLWLMSRSLRTTVVVAYSVAVAIAVALTLMAPLGLTLNALTLAGLILVVGLLVDNAVIVIEQLTRGRAARVSARSVARGLAAVWLPLVGGTLTTIVLLLPLAYLSGELRALFLPFAVLMFVTLGFSLLSAIVLLPVLAERFLGGRRTRLRPPRQGVRRVIAVYALASRRPYATCCLLALTLGVPTPWIPEDLEAPPRGWHDDRDRDVAVRYNATIGSVLVRQMRQWLDPAVGGVLRPFVERVELGTPWQLDQRPELWVHLGLPAGSGSQRPVSLIAAFEEIALAAEGVERTFVRAGDDWALMQVLLEPSSLSTPSRRQRAVRRALVEHALRVAGVDVMVWGLVPQSFHSGLGAVSGFTIEAYGPSYDRLTALSEDLATRLERNPRISEVDIHADRRGRRLVRQVLDLRWDARATARTGVRADVLAATLRARLDTRRALFFADFAGRSRLPVRLVDAEAGTLHLRDLLRQSLPVGDDVHLKLGDVARFDAVVQPDAIERADQQYKRFIQVYYSGPMRRGAETLDREIAAMPVPPGYRFEQRKATSLSDDLRHDLLWLLAATVSLVFLILAALFESWRLPWIVLASLPLALVGVAVAFLVSGAALAEGGFIGAILLVGIVVNDSILLISRYRQLEHARPGTTRRILALVALRQRLWPMWTTTLTSIAGMLPLLVATGKGEFWLGLALTVIGGLLASTLLAPAAIVALLSMGRRGIRPATAPAS